MEPFAGELVAERLREAGVELRFDTGWSCSERSMFKVVPAHRVSIRSARRRPLMRCCRVGRGEAVAYRHRDDDAIAAWVKTEWPRIKKALGAEARGSAPKTKADSPCCPQ
jgi:hypothetical protein